MEDLNRGIFKNSSDRLKLLHENLHEEISLLLLSVTEKLGVIQKEQVMIKTALLFEASLRTMKHPYDIIGQRRMKVLEDCLNDITMKKSSNRPLISTTSLFDRISKKVSILSKIILTCWFGIWITLDKMLGDLRDNPVQQN